MSADQQQNDDQLDQDQTPPAGDDQGTEADKPLSRQERRDEQARQRAQELEQERDALAGRVEALQRREIERLAGEVLAQPGDLLELGKVSLDDVLDDEGNVDPDAVAKAAAGLVETRPGLSKNAVIKGGYRDWGHSRDNRDGIGSETTSWSDAFGSASSR